MFKMGYNNEEFKQVVDKMKTNLDEKSGGDVSNDFVVANYIRG
jgi:hypothetical protein